MSESEGKRELAGLARSIDDLFTKAAQAPGAGPEPELSEPGPDLVDPTTTEPDAAVPEFDAEVAEADVEPADAEPEVPDFEPQPVEPDLEPAMELAEPESDFEAAEPDHELSIAEAYAEPELQSSPPAPHASEHDAEGEEEPTALDYAVDDYLAGDEGKVGEIEESARQLLALNEVGPVARSVRRLVHAAGSPPNAAIYGVAEALMSPIVLGRLARSMGSERDEEKRKEHYAVCRTIGEPMAHAIRDDLAESTDRLARRVHCEALVEMGEVGRKVIEEMVDDDNRFLVRNAVAILGDAGGERAVQLVTTALANPDARVRREALRSLAKLGDEESGELVVGLLDDSDRDVQIAAAVTAGELRVERALRSIIAMLDGTKDPDEAIPLIRALGQLADPSAVLSIEKHAVTSLFSKPRTDVRITAYRALNEMKTPQARRLLNKALSDKNPEVKDAVMGILKMR